MEQADEEVKEGAKFLELKKTRVRKIERVLLPFGVGERGLVIIGETIQ